MAHSSQNAWTYNPDSDVSPTLGSQNRCLGYARVSTYGQTLDVQLGQLRIAGCTKIYPREGERSDRRQLLKMLDTLAPGEVVTVTCIDRLARYTFDLLAIVKRIVDAKAQFRSLAEPWADTGTSTGRLMNAVLGGLADVERDLIRTRPAEGRSRAKAQGQQMGRPPALQKEATRRRAEGATLANLPGATMSAYPPFAARRAAHERHRNDGPRSIRLTTRR